MSITHLHPPIAILPPPLFSRFPLELFLLIVDYLPTSELSSLSRTCHSYHVLLTPRLNTHFKDQATSIACWAAERNTPAIFKRALDLVEHPPLFMGYKNINHWFENLLDSAICLERTELVRVLLDRGVSLHECCGNGTPLSNAVKLGSLEIATLLLEAGTDPDRPGCACEGFRNPGEIAWGLSSHKMVILLLKYGAAFRPRHLSPGEWVVREYRRA